ncbi:APC family permease [Clostridium sp. MT-14]|jgi:APA family basic amino acid/polyamine antiporter|uniref:Amino acid permease n=1 Tax=Clostridium aromativorans TaxID=2836848 RepID=A0ABS8NC21_9CLOT|nr:MULTISPECIES: amino acid permease [Clostridium]KAA8670499.1 amino acid permease [Clostridium sp. HV4-5-A1G]MCC9296645.1 amino acid permease [Clostridium aromativorans]CAB1251224.1 Serine/threonine exchanger SteT [Clostridiaceae bacterium BL-3]
MGKDELKKNLGLVPALALVIGIVIGAGVFFKPTAVFTATGAPGLGLIAWILGGVITIAGGLTAAEVSAAIPKTGGMIAYLEETYGDMWSFLLGWAQTIIYFPANVAALAIIFGTQAASLLGMSDSAIVPIAIIVSVFLIIMNLFGSKTGGVIQTVSTICKLIPLIAIIIIGLINGNGGTVRLLPMVAQNHPIATSLGSALVATMFAYDGWINVGAIAGEMKNPKRDLPIAIVGGLSLVMAVYLLINVAYLFVLPASALAATKTPAAAVANVIFGQAGGKIITIGILISVFGTINGYVLTGMRVPYAMAVENKLPGSKWLAKLTPNSKVPVNSGILLGIISIILIFSGKFDQLTDLLIFVIWIFYVMTFFAVFVLRKKRPDMERPYKVPGYPIVPIIAILGGLYIIFNTLFTQPLNAGLGLGVTLIGLPVYMARKNKFTRNNED